MMMAAAMINFFHQLICRGDYSSPGAINQSEIRAKQKALYGKITSLFFKREGLILLTFLPSHTKLSPQIPQSFMSGS